MGTQDINPIHQHLGSTLANLVADRLEAMVVNGGLASGERLNEVALAAELGVSRGPVRESIRILERKGLVTVVANRGAFVRKVDVEDMVDLYRIRAAITGLACELAAERADPHTLAQLRALVASMGEAAEHERQDDYYELNLAFHQALVVSSGSARLQAINEQLVAQAHLFRRGSLTRVTDMRQSNEEHIQIVEAIAAGDGARANALGGRHVDAGRERFMQAAQPQTPAARD
ncbi:FCD domain-containing protein [Comamonadaceae bacterium G21597-S1]|nr:FCD domain-containing protein [Comamonadaceae bacterium G21597-S1]